MSAQEKAGIKALARHSQKMGIRNGQINCLCGWKTETTGQVNQRKSFRRHQMREVLAAIEASRDQEAGNAEAAAGNVRELHTKVWQTWTEINGDPGEGWICNHCTPVGLICELALYPCPTIKALDRGAA